MALPASPLRWLRTWPVRSQQTARRNAMIACTSLTQRRMEHQDVEDFLVAFYGPSYASSAILKEA
jgi:hypothetical protein